MEHRVYGAGRAQLQLHNHVATLVVVEAVLCVGERFLGAKAVQKVTILAQHNNVTVGTARQCVARQTQQNQLKKKRIIEI